MHSSKPAILMLGWEYPPFINGGLGIATHGLAQALLPHTQLSLIVPFAKQTKHTNQTEPSIFGLNQITSDHFQKPSPFSDELAPLIQRIPIALDPYEIAPVLKTSTTHTKNSPLPKELQHFQNPTVTENLQHARRSLGEGGGKPSVAENLQGKPSVPNLYDQNLNTRVLHYAAVVTQLALTKNFDLIHAHDWMTFPAALEIKKLTGKPLVLHLHSTQYDRCGPSDRGWAYDLEQQAMEHADHLISVSDYTKNIITTYYNIPPQKITTIHNGITPSKNLPLPTAPPNLQPARQNLRKGGSKHPTTKPTVLFLGRLSSQKGPDFFIEIAHRILFQKPNTQFLIAGHGHKKDDLLSSIAYRKLQDHIKLLGFVEGPEKEALLQSVDLLLMPSVSEPFGLVALEAAAHGTPVILSKQSGVREILTTAPTADYHDTPALANHVIELLNNKSLYQEQAQTQQQQAIASTWENTAQRTLRLYQSLLAD